MFRFPFFLFAWILILGACQSPAQKKSAVDQNPPAPGFNREGSDSLAIQIADEVMEAMGGRQAWDQTRYLQWTFLGRRDLTWDRHSGRVRIESPADSMLYLVDLKGDEDRIFVGQMEMTAPDSVKKYAERGRRIWINDSYWLVMPFKLKDSGVTLLYIGEDSTQAGEAADLLELRFDNVGVTPENKYQIWVGKENRLVRQWAYYPEAGMQEPGFVLPWTNYKKYGGILLASGRGQRGDFPLMMGNIAAPDSLSEDFFREY